MSDTNEEIAVFEEALEDYYVARLRVETDRVASMRRQGLLKDYQAARIALTGIMDSVLAERNRLRDTMGRLNREIKRLRESSTKG